MSKNTFDLNGTTLEFLTSPGVFAQYGLDVGSEILLNAIVERYGTEKKSDISRHSDEATTSEESIMNNEAQDPSIPQDDVNPLRILDLGCGCGFIGLSLVGYFNQSKAERSKTKSKSEMDSVAFDSEDSAQAGKLTHMTTALLMDSDIRAVRLSRKNAKLNKLNTRVEVEIGDAATDVPKGQFDLVVSNPPTHQGREVVMDFIRAAHHGLRDGGEAWFVVNRMASMIKKVDEVFGNSKKVVKKKGYIVVRAVKG